MADTFDHCLGVILQNEGGFVDNPHDPGGATNLGVTLDTLSGWRHSTQTIADVQSLTPADVAPIYQSMYWNVAHCGQLPPGIDLMIFDEAVNGGPGRAIRHLQQAARVTVDGMIGPDTLAAVEKINPSTLLADIRDLREAYYRSLSNFSRFGAGWLNRLSHTTTQAHAMLQMV
jgi:lysozyme family protein